jgi:hypothetical protein
MPDFRKCPTVGNGGFSLRNIKRAVELYSSKMDILRFMHLLQSYYDLFNRSPENPMYFILRFCLFQILKILKKILVYDEERERKNNNEDVVWSFIFEKKGNIPSAIEAKNFSFDDFPEYLFELNNSELPFGCHGWMQYYNYRFFKEYIPLCES